MRYLLAWLLTLSCWSLSARGASAQIEARDLRISLDAGLLNWAKHVATSSDGERRLTSTVVGVLGGGSLALGFAVSQYVIPTLAFSLQQTKADDQEQRSIDTKRQWELRPGVEVAVVPSWRLVPFVSVGLSLTRLVWKYEQRAIGSTIDAGPFSSSGQIKTLGLGPSVGVGVHGFVVQHASLDLSLSYRALFFGKSEPPTQSKQRDHALLLNVGASFWL